jgi:CheY-specific phosphatase CheX
VTTIDVDIEEITGMIWGTLFDLPIERVGDAQMDGEPVVTGFVWIDGAWNGAVMVRCSMSLATTLTSAMFQSGGLPSFDDVTDALGELTHMVAGPGKAVLPSPCNLSLPAVALGTDYALNVLGTTSLARVSFICEARPLVVTLLQRSADTGAKSP